MNTTHVIRQADELRPNTISDDRKAAWVEGLDREVESMMLDVRGVNDGD